MRPMMRQFDGSRCNWQTYAGVAELAGVVGGPSYIATLLHRYIALLLQCYIVTLLWGCSATFTTTPLLANQGTLYSVHCVYQCKQCIAMKRPLFQTNGLCSVCVCTAMAGDML